MEAEKAKDKGGLRTGAVVVLLLLSILGYGCALALVEITLAPPAALWLAGVALAAATGLWGRHFVARVTGFRQLWLCHLVFVAVMTGVFTGSGLLVNRLGGGEAHETEAEITRVYSETRYKTRRVTRRTYARGESYKVYFAEIDLGHGVRRPVPIDRGRYRRLRPGMRVSVGLCRGALGLTFVDAGHMKTVR